MTRRGIAFIVAGVALFFLSSATQVGWVRILDAMLWGMLLLSFVLQWLCTTAVDVRRRLLTSASARSLPGPMEEDVVEIETGLRNRRFWPRFFISVISRFPMESPDKQTQRYFVATLPSNETTPVISKVHCYRRGMHHLPPATIECKVPFGLLRRRKRLAAPLSILVYPKVYSMDHARLASSLQGVSQMSRRSRTGQEAIGARDFNPGDPVRLIHWRSSARTRRLTVKEVEDTSHQSLTLAFSTAGSVGEGREATLEYAIKLAASIGVHTLRSGRAIELHAGDATGLWNDTEPFLKELALLEPSSSPALSGILDAVSPSSLLIVILPDGDSAGADAIVRSAPRLPGVTAIVLTRFDDSAPGASDRLTRAGIRVVECAPGQIEESLSQLGEPPSRTLPNARMAAAR
ncbi:MAG: DUF58 domain-containing protein [SAR202 cluster bacterium]|nr:DUF58 domain-containing protein [SAR202 cluster bacterium]